MLQSTPDNSNLLGKSKKFRVIGSLKQITGNKDGRECNLAIKPERWTLNLNWSRENSKDIKLTRLFWTKGLSVHWGGGPQIGEVTCGGSPHLSCKRRDQIKMRDYMDRRVTPPKRVTSPTWGPPPPCKQALNSISRWLHSVFFFRLVTRWKHGSSYQARVKLYRNPLKRAKITSS